MGKFLELPNSSEKSRCCCCCCFLTLLERRVLLLLCHDEFFVFLFVCLPPLPQADLNCNIQDESGSFYGVTSQYESSENMTITCSTKVCSFGKQVVEKVEVRAWLLRAPGVCSFAELVWFFSRRKGGPGATGLVRVISETFGLSSNGL